MSCDAGDGTSVTQAVNCARSLVSNSSVIGEVGDFEFAQDQVNAVLNAAKVPNIDPPPYGQSVLTSPNAFPLEGSEGAAITIPLADAGAKKISIAYVNNPQIAGTVQLSQAILAKARPGTTVTGGIPSTCPPPTLPRSWPREPAVTGWRWK